VRRVGGGGVRRVRGLMSHPSLGAPTEISSTDDDEVWRERARRIEKTVEGKGEEEGPLWSDRTLTEIGVQVWENVFKGGGTEADLHAFVAQAAEAWGKNNLEPLARRGLISGIFSFTGHWAVHAFQRVTTTHTFAAALMCSDADKDALHDIEIQWKAFMVIIPNGCLKTHRADYTRILVSSFEDRATLALLDQSGPGPDHLIFVQSNNLASLLDVSTVPEYTHTAGADASDQTTRAMVMAKRLVAGLLLAIQHRDNFKEKKVAAKSGSRWRGEREEPEHRVVMVGRPLTVDCRQKVTEFIRGDEGGARRKRGGPPSVQVLVRGFFRRQVVGVGRTGRKVIWIEPFWRGPKGAPIWTRPKKVVGP